ncbi:protein FAR1-RELATED SEQUENCE 5-like [Olea europaea var. sylvestris]|uniref:protein FAR1-RELATED SEQUENCE 5-like n=1 Tax=Olea europaea var. sylvestris TaxID=158386 RepID=UPI000C1D73A3|nr:protein FAR1-RELATED SEQUENCE 5-like [Olea europaea var. sylvestris]
MKSKYSQLDHNHKMSPSKSRLYQCNRELTANIKRKLEVNDIVGISLHKSYNFVVVEAGDYESITFIEKDYHRCRQAYKEFSDVVTFDTTYLTNKYDKPFFPFVGINHHGQSTLFGCSLIANEDTNIFVWLLRTWLQCMHGQAPNEIITDQDRAMQNAIKFVFPHTKHRWCLWHILKKLPEKFGYHDDKASIFFTIHGLVCDSHTVDEFEKGWRAMIDMYKLYDNDWLAGLFANRGRWVPCFLKATFWAGMSTTQRSESMNVFFDGYMHSKTSLKQFVEQYERALWNKVEKKFQANFKSYVQMGFIETIYEVREDVLLYEEHRMKRTFFVSYTKETQDILLLDKFILWQWRRDISRAHTRIAVYYAELVNTLAQLRYEDICRAFSEVDGLVAND